MKSTRVIAITLCHIVVASILAGRNLSAQDSWGGVGTYDEPYWAKTNATLSQPSVSYSMGQDFIQQYGICYLERRETNIVYYRNAAGFEVPRSVTGGAIKFDYTGETDANGIFTGELTVHEREYKNIFVPAIGMIDGDNVRTLEWESSWNQIEDFGTQSAVARVSAGQLGFIDYIDYQFEFHQNQWSLDVERSTPGFFPEVGQGSGSCFYLSDTLPSATIPDPVILYGTMLDWLWDPLKRSLLNTMGSTGGLNIVVPTIWTQSQMSWMWPSV